jgi:hypothetical protein
LSELLLLLAKEKGRLQSYQLTFRGEYQEGDRTRFREHRAQGTNLNGDVDAKKLPQFNMEKLVRMEKETRQRLQDRFN